MQQASLFMGTTRVTGKRAPQAATGRMKATGWHSFAWLCLSHAWATLPVYVQSWDRDHMGAANLSSPPSYILKRTATRGTTFAW